MRQNKILYTVLSLFLSFSWACDDGSGGRADADADVPAEDGAEDTAVEPDADAADPEDEDLDVEEEEIPTGPEGYCRACSYDSDCEPGGACIEMDEGELGCGIPCELPTDCPTGSDCENVPESETRQCVPASGTCVWDPMGSPCPSWGCSGRNDLCSDPTGVDGTCTHACRDAADCDVGYMRCLDRGDGVSVCMKNLPEPAARCGVTEHASGVGSPCGSATCADSDFVCATDLDASLPALCVRPCDSDTDCPTGEEAACVSLAGLPAGQKYCVPDECRCLGVVPGSLFDALLEEGGLSRCDLAWDVEALTDYFGPELAQDRFRIPWTDDVHNDWLRALPATYEIEEKLDAAASLGTGRVIVEAAALSGHPIAGGETSFEPAASDPLVSAMAELLTELGEVPDMTGLEADAADVPADVQVFAARLILAITQAVISRSQALAVLEGDSWEINHYYLRTPFLFLPTTLGGSLDVTSRRVQDFLIGKFDYALLYQAAYDLAHTVELHASDVADHPASESFSFSQSTPAGRVEIRDGGNTQYIGAMTSADYLLVLDAGGDDEYQIGAGSNTSGDNPVSVLVDLGGGDTYAYFEVPDPNDGSRLVSDADGRIEPTADYGPWTLSKTPRQGSGRLGIGMLFDFGGMDDEYRSLRMSQGSGILGVGLLFDDGGSDRYDCEAGCQGSGAFGLGIHVDAGGPGTGPGDVYNAYHAAQGFAYAIAVGILYDHQGDETYFCNQGDVLYPSPQSDTSNSSLCQGMGFGRRADEWLGLDGVFMSGGIGILRDLAGADDYTSAVFGQGGGYWFGFGFLLDAAGDDAYNGRYYVQGSTAHYATSVLHDGDGQDTYNREEVFRLNGILGAGHDFSSSFLVDDGGSDLYFSPGRSLGTANDNAFGILIDRQGDDAFQCNTNYSLGNANLSPEIALTRGGFPTIGMFMDCGGTDTYDRPDTALPGNDVTWQQEMHPDSSSETGLGGDTSTMPCGL